MEIGAAREILDLAHSAFVSMGQDGRILYWNVRAEELFGLTREQALGRDVAEVVIPQRFRAAHREGIARFLATGESRILNRRMELPALTSDGREIPVEIALSALRASEEWTFTAFILDISDRLAADRERSERLEELQDSLRGTEQRLAVIVNALAEAVTIRVPSGELVYANQAALDRMGFDSVEAFRRADQQGLVDRHQALAEDGSELRIEDLPSVRLLRGEEPEPLMLRSVDPDTGEEEWLLLKAAAIRDPDGSIEAAVTIIEDVTAAKRVALRAEFLARASQALASSLDYEQTLRTVAGLAVPQFADWCAVDLFDERGTRESVAVAHIDPEKIEMAERMREFGPQELDPDQGLGRVLRTGEPSLFNEIPDELLAAGAVSAEHLDLLRAVGMKAALIVPMSVGGRVIGALTLVSAESSRTFEQADLEAAVQIAERAALAVENARLYRGRSHVARTLQSSLLPEALPSLPGWEVAALYRPAGSDGDVGGDFYDIWEVGREWMMMIGDVTGKGVAAAAVTALVRHTAWAASDFDPRPAEILARVDTALKRRPSLPVCTALCLRIDGERGTLALGGHPPLIHLGEHGAAELGEHGTLLGGFPKVRWPETSFTLRPGETLVAITDGVTDTVGSEQHRFGAARLQSLLASCREDHPQAIRERLLAELQAFQVGAQADDTAVVIMRFNGAPARSREGSNINLRSAGIGV